MDTTKRIMQEIMDKVKDARKRAGLTQAEVADALNIRDSTFNGYENLNRTLSIADLVRLPSILGCRITDLLPDSVVTDYDRARALNHRLQDITDRWTLLDEEEHYIIHDPVKVMTRKRKGEE